MAQNKLKTDGEGGKFSRVLRITVWKILLFGITFLHLQTFNRRQLRMSMIKRKVSTHNDKLRCQFTKQSMLE